MHTPRQYLALFLDAPLQSWGYQSKFDRRTTLSFPTRSGVLGMICAAMGIDRADSARLKELDALEMTVYILRSGNRLTDFHTVGGGWDPKKAPGNVVRTAERKFRDTVLTYREYLQCGKFGVVLSGPASLLAEIANALPNPRWGIWLGRKSCIPASPVFQGLFDDGRTALARLCEIAGTDSPPVRTILEVVKFADGSDTIMDRPVDFADRTFAPRRILLDTT